MPSIRRIDPLYLILTAGIAAADPALRDDDRERLFGLDAAAGSALLEAFASGGESDLDLLRDALRGNALPADEAATLFVGNWECRMIKMGGPGLPLVAYSPFTCRATAEGRFDKTTGSQRSTGYFAVSGDELIYWGTGYIAGDNPPDYADLPQAVDPAVTPQRLPEVGRIELTGPDSARILLPDPHVESRFNILTLRR